MPVGGIAQESLQVMKQQSQENPGIMSAEKLVKGVGTPEIEGGSLNGDKNAKINMEAYQAYYNTHENNEEAQDKNDK